MHGGGAEETVKAEKDSRGRWGQSPEQQWERDNHGLSTRSPSLGSDGDSDGEIIFEWATVRPSHPTTVGRRRGKSYSKSSRSTWTTARRGNGI